MPASQKDVVIELVSVGSALGEDGEERGPDLCQLPQNPREQLSPRPAGGSRKLSLKTPGSCWDKGFFCFGVISFLWAMLLVLKVYKVAECPSGDTWIDGLVPTDLAKFQMSISCFKLCTNQMMALLPGYSQVSLPLTPFFLRRNHLIQLL